MELLSKNICLAWTLFLDENRITNQISICCILLFTGIQLLFAYPENHVEICFVILFLWLKKFHAKRIVGPCLEDVSLPPKTKKQSWR